jgi:copper chaperone NosL
MIKIYISGLGRIKNKLLRLFLIIFVLTSVVSCGQEQTTGAVEVKWDRDACDRCQMMLSERNFSAQIRVFPEGKRSKVYKFDDFGCAVLWLDKQEYKSNPKTEIWVNDYKLNKWLNAKQAWFVKGEISPMGYGLGAQESKVDNAINFEQAVEHIFLVEKNQNIHGGNLEH